MSMLDTLQVTGRINKPPRIMIYGPQKIGKSTFAAMAPDPVFIQIEDGLDGLCDPTTKAPLEVSHFPQATTLQDVLDAMRTLLAEEHTFKTLAVDSLDWLEALIWKEVCLKGGVESIEEFGYGKGYVEALSHWRHFLDGLNALRNYKGMALVLLAHAEIKSFNSPTTSNFDRYQPKLHKSASALVQEAVDVIGFVNWETVIVEEKMGFNAVTKKAKGSGKRVLHMEERPAFLAGARYQMPAQIDFSWQAFIEAFNAATNQGPVAPDHNPETQAVA